MTQDIKLDVHEAMIAPTEHPQWEFEDEDEDGESKGIYYLFTSCTGLLIFVYKPDFITVYFFEISGDESDDEFATDDDYDDDD